MTYKSNLTGVEGNTFSIGEATLDVSNGTFVVRMPSGDIYMPEQAVFGVDSISPTPDPTPTFQGYYIVGLNATGEWAGKDSQVAYYDGSNWSYHIPAKGWKAYVSADGYNYTFDGLIWSKDALDPDMVVQAIQTAADSNVFTDSYKSKLDNIDGEIIALAVALG